MVIPTTGDQSPVKRKAITQAAMQKRSKKALPDVQKAHLASQEYKDSSSNVECYRSEKHYSTYLKESWKRKSKPLSSIISSRMMVILCNYLKLIEALQKIVLQRMTFVEEELKEEDEDHGSVPEKEGRRIFSAPGSSILT